VHHVEARVFKDVFPRFKTMRGYRVDRKAGWDCHGLPVEVAVEKELGLSGKQQILEYGLAEFNQRCRESVTRHVDAFEQMTAAWLLGRHAERLQRPWTRVRSRACGGR
jgi:isoleucyl-tRNA synthetase